MGFALAGVALACGGPEDPEGRDVPLRPNVLLITLDTTRADALGSYGHPGGATPRLDAIARDGTLFENTQSASAATPISHASILTGLYPYHHGVRVISAASGFHLDDRVPTLATLLERDGYATAAVHSSFTVSRTFGLGSGFDHFDDLNTSMTPVDGEDRVDWDMETFQRRADETSQRVVALLDQLPEPFLLWIHYWDPHDKVKRPPAAFLRGGDEHLGGDALYAEEVRYMDQQIGLVVDALVAARVWDHTVAVVTSDHGQGLSDGLARHGWRGHRRLYQEQLHVPLIVRVPGMGQGRRVSELVRTVDILPTLLDLLGIEAPADLDGASLWPLIEGRPDPAPSRVAYADQLNGYDWNARRVQQTSDADFLYSVNDGRWKLIYRPSHPQLSELFDLRADPEESRDLAREQPAEVERLLRDLARRRPWVDRPFPADESELSDAERAALVALGYAEEPRARSETGPVWGWRCPQGGPIQAQPGTCDEGVPMVLVARPDAPPDEGLEGRSPEASGGP